MCRSHSEGGRRCNRANTSRQSRRSLKERLARNLRVLPAAQGRSATRIQANIKRDQDLLAKFDRAKAIYGEHVISATIPLPNTVEPVLRKLRAAGMNPLLVGGSVRDHLLGLPAADLDFEVYGGSLEDIKAALGRGTKIDEVGKAFGILTAHLRDGNKLDLSVPRRDSKTGIGHKGFAVTFDSTLTVEEAATRRDFTINTMSYDPALNVIVDYHSGVEDLRARILRHVGPAFSEDPLRVLRGVQFAGRFEMDIHPDTARLCQALSDQFSELPTERVFGEWRKIATKAKKPSLALKALHDTGWEKHFPPLARVREVPQDAHWHPEGPVHVHLALAADKAVEIAERDRLNAADREVLVFAAMFHDLGKAEHTQHHPDGKITSHGHSDPSATKEMLTILGAPKHLHDQILPLVAEHMAQASTKEPTQGAVRKLQRRLLGNNTGPTLEQWARLVEADKGGRGAGSRPPETEAWLALAADTTKPQGGLLTGRHLIDLGMKPGPEFKDILAAALTAQDEGVFSDESGALAWFAENHPARVS